MSKKHELQNLMTLSNSYLEKNYPIWEVSATCVSGENGPKLCYGLWLLYDMTLSTSIIVTIHNVLN